MLQRPYPKNLSNSQSAITIVQGTKVQSITASIKAPLSSWCHNKISKTTQRTDKFVSKVQTCKQVKPTFRILFRLSCNCASSLRMHVQADLMIHSAESFIVTYWVTITSMTLSHTWSPKTERGRCVPPSCLAIILDFCAPLIPSQKQP